MCVKQREAGWKLLQYITHNAGTAFCSHQLSSGFIMCLLLSLKSLWPGPDAVCVLFELE